MELEELMNESIEKLEGNFYSKKFYFSYSSLNKLMWSPAVFHQLYVLGIKEERQDAHLVQGKIIHALLLEPEKFQDNFVISPDNLPTGNTKTVIDRVFSHHKELANNGDTRTSLVEFTDAIIDILKDMNLHQSLKTDQQRIDKIFTPDAVNYWNFLRSKGNKTLIDQQSYDFCVNAVDMIKTDSKLCTLLGHDLNDFSNKEVFNELPLMVDMADKSFGLKGIVDNLVIDHDKKILYINDVKTTSKDLKDFPETVEFYSYWMQAVIYSTLVSINFSNLREAGYE
ncbi:hypothetical protein EBQ81_00750, partial [bacterium]|nr:hypothetical protein [bacterium]